MGLVNQRMEELGFARDDWASHISPNEVACPTCGADVGRPCGLRSNVAATSGRAHAARRDCATSVGLWLWDHGLLMRTTRVWLDKADPD